ncbi:unnamed protein product [Dovyalis caffra]|uniref:Uncharacterized protein n=1 Tax=Dovyalis caffra TaxID=77055 RepID=A0AAV1QWQ8_9ROSI|nr:unnamed protein product [Dovyalis caffra]
MCDDYGFFEGKSSRSIDRMMRDKNQKVFELCEEEKLVLEHFEAIDGTQMASKYKTILPSPSASPVGQQPSPVLCLVPVLLNSGEYKISTDIPNLNGLSTPPSEATL